MTEAAFQTTHGFCCDDIDAEAVHRKICVHKLEDGSYGLTMTTQGPDDLEPFITQLLLGKQALDMLAFATAEALTEMDSYPITT